MSDLYTIALLFRGGERQVTMVFQSRTSAEEVWVLYSGDEEEAEDDYGTRVRLLREGVLEAIVMQDAGRAHEGGIEMGLLQARAQSRANARAQHDPMIKAVAPGTIMMPR